MAFAGRYDDGVFGLLQFFGRFIVSLLIRAETLELGKATADSTLGFRDEILSDGAGAGGLEGGDDCPGLA